jgi:hypothetical protein
MYDVALQDINLVQSLVRLYAALLQPMINPPPPPPPGAPPSAEKPIVIVDPQVGAACYSVTVIPYTAENYWREKQFSTGPLWCESYYW